jgi:hypothetical protein
MLPISSEGASSRSVRLLSGHRLKIAAAILMLGAFNGVGGAYAQTNPDPAACTEKCKAEETKCLNAQGSEEMCDYDLKMCKKECGGDSK